MTLLVRNPYLKKKNHTNTKQSQVVKASNNIQHNPRSSNSNDSSRARELPQQLQQGGGAEPQRISPLEATTNAIAITKAGEPSRKNQDGPSQDSCREWSSHNNKNKKNSLNPPPRCQLSPKGKIVQRRKEEEAERNNKNKGMDAQPTRTLPDSQKQQQQEGAKNSGSPSLLKHTKKNKKKKQRGVTFLEPHTKPPASSSRTTTSLTSALMLKFPAPTSTGSNSSNPKLSTCVEISHRSTTSSVRSRPPSSLLKTKLKSKYKQEIAALKKQRQRQLEMKRLAQIRQQQQQKEATSLALLPSHAAATSSTAQAILQILPSPLESSARVSSNMHTQVSNGDASRKEPTQSSSNSRCEQEEEEEEEEEEEGKTRDTADRTMMPRDSSRISDQEPTKAPCSRPGLEAVVSASPTTTASMERLQESRETEKCDTKNTGESSQDQTPLSSPRSSPGPTLSPVSVVQSKSAHHPNPPSRRFSGPEEPHSGPPVSPKRMQQRDSASAMRMQRSQPQQHPHVSPVPPPPHLMPPVHPAPSSSSFWRPSSSSSCPPPSASPLGAPYGYNEGGGGYYYSQQQQQHQAMLHPPFLPPPTSTPTSPRGHSHRSYVTPGGSGGGNGRPGFPSHAAASPYYASPAQQQQQQQQQHGHHPHSMMAMMYPGGPYSSSNAYHHPDIVTRGPYPPLLGGGGESMDEDDSPVDLSYNGPPLIPPHPQYPPSHHLMPRMDPYSATNGGGPSGGGMSSRMGPGPHPHPYGPAPPGFYSGPSHPQHYWTSAPSWAPFPPQFRSSSNHRASPTLSPRYRQYSFDENEQLSMYPHPSQQQQQHPHARGHDANGPRIPLPLPVLQPMPSRPVDSNLNDTHSTTSTNSSSLKKTTTTTPPASANAIVKVMAQVLEPPCPMATDYEKLDTVIGLLKPRPSKGETSSSTFGISIQVNVTSTLVDPMTKPCNAPALEEGKSVDVKSGSGDVEEQGSEQVGNDNKDNSSDTTKQAVSQEESSLSKNQVSGDNVVSNPPIRRRRRRRRVFFAALTILDASVQNERLKQQASAKNSNDESTANEPLVLLEPGDVILSIAGQPTAGLNFAQCCKLFQQSSGQIEELEDEIKKDSDSTTTHTEEKKEDDAKANDNIVVPIEIARRKKPKSSPPSNKALVRTSDSKQVSLSNSLQKVVITEGHLSKLARVMLEYLLDLTNGSRLLGRGETLEMLLRPKLIFTLPDISESDSGLTDLMTNWHKNSKSSMRKAYQRATQHWKDQWSKDEPKAILEWHPVFLSDRQRSILRGAPRPAVGCKCSCKDHMFVNHPDCPLYSNLVRLEQKIKSEQESNDDDDDKAMELVKKNSNPIQKESLNTVESAVLDRFKRHRDEKNAEDEEARFVMRMEQLQLETCKQAIEAPSLTVMVLSAVVELCKEDDEEKEKSGSHKTSDERANPQEQSQKQGDEGNDDDDDEDEDDDVPLAELAKRQDTAESPTKKQRRASHLSMHYMARLARHISWTWGHVAREPSHLDHAWRWEVFSGQHSQNTAGSSSSSSTSPTSMAAAWDSKQAQNPRRPGSYSWENVRWLLDKDTVQTPLQEMESSSTKAATNDEEQQARRQEYAVQCLAQVLDPRRGTGLMEEIMALVHSNVLELADQSSQSSRLQLALEWYLNVDVLVLEQMDASWGKDPLRYRIPSEIVTTLQREWIKTTGGRPKYGDNNNNESDSEEDGELSEAAWASRWAPEEPIYELDEFVTWRQAFEQREETQSNQLHGIGQFGV